MDVRQLSALLAVAEHGTFSAAADALHTVQSNVSTHIARLEKELGTSLIDRQAGRLTHEGDAVVRRARRIMAEFEAVKTDVDALNNEVTGDARIGMIGTTARWLVPDTLRLMKERYPQTNLRVVEGTTSILEPQLLAGTIDLAVVLLPVSSPEIATQPLFEEDMVLLIQPDHHLAGEDQIDMRELSRIPLLLPPPGTQSRLEIDTAAKAAGVTLQTKAEIEGVRLTASLTFDGHGPAILPSTALPIYMRENWTLLRVEGLPRRRVGLAQLRRSYPGAQVRALRDILSEVITIGAETHTGLYPPD